jgi:NADH-quinone oxidoreductase subunit E
LNSKLGIGPGETTPDGRITIKEVECLGACGGAPMMQVNKDYHELLTAEKIDRILEELE